MKLTESEYNSALKAAEELITKIDLTEQEESQLASLAESIEAYEDEHFPLPEINLFDRIRHYFEQRINYKKIPNRLTYVLCYPLIVAILFIIAIPPVSILYYVISGSNYYKDLCGIGGEIKKIFKV